VKDKIRAARDHVDGIDLQQSHARNGGNHIIHSRPRARSMQQPLRRKMKPLRLRQA
jgi:hypothetical protein